MQAFVSAGGNAILKHDQLNYRDRMFGSYGNRNNILLLTEQKNRTITYISYKHNTPTEYQNQKPKS
jgi:hypothetical protein